MNSTDKLLRAFIEASGYEVEEVITRSVFFSAEVPTKDEFINGMGGNTIIDVTDYKVTKTKFNKSHLHKAVRLYENGELTISELLNEIAKLESLPDEEV
jgi:hypothetical protein